MITLRNVLLSVYLTLMVAVSVSAAPSASDTRAPNTGTKTASSVSLSLPVVKIDCAMLQEQQTLPDGTIYGSTMDSALSVTEAKAKNIRLAPNPRAIGGSPA